MNRLRIGWAAADLTPGEPVELTGQFHLRMSEGVLDPITATVLALDSGEGHVVLVSCDLVGIPPTLARLTREASIRLAPELAATDVILSATHTHTGPEVRLDEDLEQMCHAASCMGKCVDLPGMAPKDYVAWAAKRIGEAVAEAWRNRAPGALSYGLGHAVVGRNRLTAYIDGTHRMYGPTADPAFSHIEGYEDHDVNLLATWSPAGELSGLLVNLACPSQETEILFHLSADFWCETRAELRRRFGEGLPILVQCSAAGDQSPHIPYNWAAEDRMRRLAGRSAREEIAMRIADAVSKALPLIERERHDSLPIEHRVALLDVPRSRLTQADVDTANAQAEALMTKYAQLRDELEAHPERRAQPRWYAPLTGAFRKAQWYRGVAKRFASDRESPTVTAELHALRIGPIAMVTNPHEYYLDYGIRIKARSAAEQTFIVQLAGWGTYVPARRALAGNSYGATPASNPIGAEGGEMMTEWAIGAIAEIFASGEPRQASA